MAEQAIVNYVQRQHFSEEIASLSDGKAVKKKGMVGEIICFPHTVGSFGFLMPIHWQER